MRLFECLSGGGGGGGGRLDVRVQQIFGPARAPPPPAPLVSGGNHLLPPRPQVEAAAVLKFWLNIGPKFVFRLLLFLRRRCGHCWEPLLT